MSPSLPTSAATDPARPRRLLAALRDDRWARALLVILLGAFALRLLVGLAWSRDPAGKHDPHYYVQAAEGVAAGHGYLNMDGEPGAYFPVGYPVALGGVVWVADRLPGDLSTPRAAGLLNAVVGTATVGLMALAGRRLAGPAVGLVTAGVVALYPNLVLHTALALSETLFNGFLAAALVVAVAPRRGPPSLGRLAAVGALLGAATLVRPVALAVLPFLVVAWWLSGVGIGRALGQVAVIAGLAVLVIVPWTIRNAIVLDSFVFVSTNTGDNLCIGHHEDATGAFNLSDRCFSDVDGLGEVERDERLTRRAVDYAAGHPVDELRLTWWRFFYQYRGDADAVRAVQSYGEDPWLTDREADVLESISDGYYFAVLGLALVGIPSLWSRRDPRRLVYFAFVAGVFVAPLLFFGDERFKVPVMLLLAIPAALTLSSIRALRGRFSPTGVEDPGE